jgi:hypothetical protein
MPNNAGTKLESIDPGNQIALSQEKTRTWLAKFLAVFIVVFVTVVVILSICFHDKSYYVIFDAAITGLIGLLGGVIGFYFGGKH